MFQVTPGDALLLGMLREPAFAVPQQLLHFVAGYPIVLLVVEDGDQHVEVREQVGQPRRLAQFDREVRPLAPFGELLVERMPGRMIS